MTRTFFLSNSLLPHGLYSPWNSPGQNTGVDSVQFSCSVMSDYLWPHGLQHTRPSCTSPTAGVYSNSCPLSWWCNPTISSSVIPFSSHLAFPSPGDLPNPGIKPRSPALRADSLLSHKGRPRIMEWVDYPFSRGSSQPRNQTGVSCIAAIFFTNWAIREAHDKNFN